MAAIERSRSPTPVYDWPQTHDFPLKKLSTWDLFIKELEQYQLRITDDFDSIDELPEALREFCVQLQVCISGQPRDIRAALEEFQKKALELNEDPKTSVPEILITP